jgi:hypothetical protein
MRCIGHKLGLAVGIGTVGAAARVVAQTPGLLAQADEPETQSFASWLIQSLGLFGFLALLSAVLIFIGACAVVCLARRPAVIAAYVVFLPLPLLLAVMGALQGLVGAFGTVGRSGIELKQGQTVGLLAEVLVQPLSALMLTLPSYLVIAVALFVRTLLADRARPSGGGRDSP